MGKRILRLKAPISVEQITKLLQQSHNFIMVDGSTLKAKLLQYDGGKLELASRIGKKINIEIKNISEIHTDILANW